MDNVNHRPHRPHELGISVELDPAVAHDLRQQEEKRRRKRQSRNPQLQQQQQQNDEYGDDDDDDDDLNNDFERLQNEEEEDWNQVIQTIEYATGRELSYANDNAGTGEARVKTTTVSNNQQEDEEDEDDTVEIKDEISLSPDDPMASSLPLVLVNIRRLMGYQPSSLDEVECLKTQIQSALYGQQPQQPQQQPSDDVENKDPATTTTTTTTTTATNAASIHSDTVENSESIATTCDDDFDGRLVEMFTKGSAHHSDTVRVAQLQQQQLLQQPYSFAVIPYPELLCRKPRDRKGRVADDDDEATQFVYTTRQIWKALLKRHVVPVVDRFFVHVRNCSRSLVWKYEMRRELLELCRCQSRQLQQDKLNAWRAGQRREKLEKLYHVREMFVHRLDMAQEHLDILNSQREEAVQQALRLKRNQTGQAIGVEALDFATTSVMTFPTQQELNQLGVSIGNSLIIGLQDDDDDDDDYDDDGYYEDDYESIGSDNDDEDEEYDDVGPNEGLAPVSETTGLDDEVDGGAADTVATIDTTAGAADDMMASGEDAAECIDNYLAERVAKRESRRQAARQRRLQEVATAKEEEHKAKLEAAKKDEELVREACTTQEHKIAMAKVQCFQDRLTGVDNLLESLQEDEWADEETTEGEEQVGRVAPIDENGMVDGKKAGGRDDILDFTLLDQLLLTVLGSIHVPMGTRAADHAAWQRTEHLEIVAEWKKHFGSLPPFLQRSSSPGLDDNRGAPSSSPHASTCGSPNAAFQADVSPSATDATSGRPVGQASITQAAWGPNAVAPTPPQSVSVSRPAHEIRESLGIVDNEDEDWEA